MAVPPDQPFKDEAFLVQTAQTRPDNAPVHVICDNLSVNTTPKIRRWAARNDAHLYLTPTYASWANPIEAQFGPVRSGTAASRISVRGPRCVHRQASDGCDVCPREVRGIRRGEG